MTIRRVPADRPGDAEILASLQGLHPVPSPDAIDLLPRRRVIGMVEERCSIGEGGSAPLRKALEFDGESVFRRAYSQVSSCRLTLRTSTLFQLLGSMSGGRESVGDHLPRLLAPVVEETLERLDVDDEKRRLLRYSLDNWLRPRSGTAAGPGTDACTEGAQYRTSMSGGSLPEELSKTSRYFLKNLFRLNNLHGDNEFYHPPEVVEDYWEVISPDQGTFDACMTPAARELTVGLFRTSRGFGMNRTENDDYFRLLEFLTSERRDPRVHGCRVELHGPTYEDELYLQEALGIETMLVEAPIIEGSLAGRPLPLSDEGERAFRSLLRQMSGVRAEVQFPINVSDPDHGQEDFSVLGFDLMYDAGADMFRLDGVPVDKGSIDALAVMVGEKLLALSRRAYHSPEEFPAPDVDRLEREVHDLISRAEGSEPTEEAAREIVAKITVLDYYESLARYSFALGEQLRAYLEGTQVVTVTVPLVLLALLNVGLDERPADDRLRSQLGREG